MSPNADAPPRRAFTVLRATVVVPQLVTAQFFTHHGDGRITAAGILSMPLEDWRTPAWQRVREAMDVVDDFTSP